MDAVDCVSFASELLKHYPKATEGDVELVVEIVQGLSLEQAVAVVKAVRGVERSAYRPNLSALRARAQAERSRGYSPGARRHERVVDWLRREHGTKWRGMSDFEVISKHYRECWHSLQHGCEHPDPKSAELLHQPGAPDEYTRQFVRTLVRAHAKNAFVELGIPSAEAQGNADVIVDLNEGDKIRVRELIRRAEDVKPTTSRQALDALVKHEKAKGKAA